MNPEFLSKLKKPANIFYIGFGISSMALFYGLASYFSNAAVRNAKSYYKDGGRMQQEIPEEFKEEFYQKVKRKRQFKNQNENNKGQKTSDIDIIN